MPDCARCGRDATGGWFLGRRWICDRRSCVASASHRLLRGILPDDHDQLDRRSQERALAFDQRQKANAPAPPPWARGGRR